MGDLGAALRKGSKASGERGRGRGRQAASRLYIPAVLIYHVTAPVDSQPRKRGREGRGGLGEGSGTPIVLGPSGASLVGCGAMFQPAYLPKKEACCILPHLPLAAALSLRATSIEEFKYRGFPPFLSASGSSSSVVGTGFGGSGGVVGDAQSCSLTWLPSALHSWAGQLGGFEAVLGWVGGGQECKSSFAVCWWAGAEERTSLNVLFPSH